jgi:hypothetical protein
MTMLFFYKGLPECPCPEKGNGFIIMHRCSGMSINFLSENAGQRGVEFFSG